MEEKEVKNWGKFEAEIKNIYAERERLRAKLAHDHGQGYVSKVRFRGQANSGWRLRTPLDRYVEKEFKVIEYYQLISKVKPQIETFTDMSY